MYTSFVLILLGFCLLALGFILFPLIRDAASRAKQQSRREVNTQIHYDRVRELEQDLENGTLSREQFDQAMYDLERDLVQSGAIDPDDEEGTQMARGNRTAVVTAALVSCIALPAMAFSVYGMVGDPDAATPSSERASQQVNLAQRVAWQGFTAQDREKIAEAERLYEIAMRIGARKDADLLTYYADFLATLQNGDFRGRPDELIDEILDMDPNHVMGLRLAANSAYNKGDFETARSYLQQALDNAREGSQVARQIENELQRLPD
ncbi:c-type cytochrome biogenesis protein CcmI [Halorhodospira halochloris]|uniref:c-type cytochrome biogenesis protein CcmI n=1 Tax=Halorhodospira halochloris TaxID=1052 RepID=UPI001EE8A15D|nr:c-type cytochrome biogenesis protein CcmI [Halorhodospira halochloris]MCG5547908.1 c-type cytochrome biogenesis protein CcmI [Halorhodospira halochloris]